MEHHQAKEMHAAEKYVLGELPSDERDAFEEHYFDCAECALDVQTAAAFVTASKQIFREEPTRESADSVATRVEPSFWAKWLKPLIAIPTLAALVVMLAYEARQIQRSHEQETAGTKVNLVATADFGLHGGDRNEGETVTVRVHSGEPFRLHFDFTPAQHVAGYIGEVQDRAGHAVIKLGIPAERINKEVSFVVAPGQLTSGNYNLVIYGQDLPTSAVLAKYAFAIEIIP